MFQFIGGGATSSLMMAGLGLRTITSRWAAREYTTWFVSIASYIKTDIEWYMIQRSIEPGAPRARRASYTRPHLSTTWSHNVRPALQGSLPNALLSSTLFRSPSGRGRGREQRRWRDTQPVSHGHPSALHNSELTRCKSCPRCCPGASPSCAARARTRRKRPPGRARRGAPAG